MYFTAYNESLFFTKSIGSILALISTMTANALAAGDYVIYNHALGLRGETLAFTFHDVQTPPTVEILGSVSDNSQIVCSLPSLLSFCLFSYY